MAAASVTLIPWLLGPAREARVIACGPAAGYLDVPGGGLVALLSPRAVRLPIGVVLPAAEAARLAGIRPGDVLVVGEGRVLGAGLAVAVRRWWSPRVTALPGLLGAAAVAGRIGVAARALPGAPEQVLAPAAALSRALAGTSPARVADAARALVGLGPGLTPAGDDVVCGALVALAAVCADGPRGRLAAAADLYADATTSLSAALLRGAACGDAVPQLSRLLRSLAGPGTDEDVAAAAAELARVGASSGTALGHGALLGLRAVRARYHGRAVEEAA